MTTKAAKAIHDAKEELHSSLQDDVLVAHIGFTYLLISSRSAKCSLVLLISQGYAWVDA